MRKKNVLFVVVLFFGSLTYAQLPFDPLKQIPPSPTAASLGAYGNNPVSYYNGTIGLTVPLYEIKTTNFSLPIKLEYFSTGVKVADNAGWTGLGWSLSVGGVITKTVKGGDDLFGTGSTRVGYYDAGTIPNKLDVLSTYWPNLSPNDQDYLFNFDQGWIDTEPDVFNYNFNNYSGRFVLGKSVNGSPVYVDQKNNLKMQYLQQADNWLVTDAYGFKYYFNVKEKTQDYYRSLENGEIPNDSQIGTFDNYEVTGNPLITTSWYLNAIVAPNGETVSFIYDVKPERQSATLISKSETEYGRTSLSSDRAYPIGDPRYSGPTLSGIYHQNTASKQVIIDVYLKQINFSGGTILFNTTDRDDIEYIGTEKPKKLSQIVIKDLTNKELKKYSFNYSYFLSNTTTSLTNDYTNKRRLKLDSVIETGTDDQSKPPYIFDYYNANDVPYKYTKAMDHWGYYNGKTANTSILPGKIVPSVNTFWKGADRSANQTDTDMVKGVLSSVTYPTGGSSKFDYELNEYGNLKEDDQYTFQPQSAIANSMIGKYSVDFNIAVLDTTVVTLKGTFKKSGDVVYIGDYAHIYKDGNIIYQFLETAMQPSGQYLNPQTLDFILFPGHYSMDIRNIEGVTTAITANWDKRTIVTQKKGAGLRIKRITNYANNSITGVKKFLYNNTDGSTTGRLIMPLLYSFPVSVTEERLASTGPSNPVAQNFHDYTYLVRMSNTIGIPSLSQNSGAIGYDKVTELDGENGENGKIEYYYTNKEVVTSPNSVPYIPVIHNPMNGKMNKAIYYNSFGDTIKKTQYQYILKDTQYLKGLTKLSTFPEANRSSIIYHTVDIRTLKFYNIPSYWVVPSVEEETLFSKDQSQITVTKKSYFDNYTHLNLTSSEIISSIGKSKKTKYFYAQDSETGSLPFVSEMITKNMINIPLKTQTFNENTKLSEELNVFDKSTSTNDLLLPKSVYTAKFPNTLPDVLNIGNLEKKITYDLYDNKGNILQYTAENGISVSIIWGYNQTQPIAKIENALYSQIATYVTNLQDRSNADNDNCTTNTCKEQLLRVDLNALRAVLPNAMITTYTYDPLIGVTSITDPKGDIITYIYDALGRLETVKDKNGDVLSQNQYKYKQ
jgi:YD repeat-containing protein